MAKPETSRAKVATPNGTNATGEELNDIDRNAASSAWADRVRELLLQVWGDQACQRPDDWPDVRRRLLEQLASVVDSAVAELARLFGGAPPDDPALAVWRTFPKLDRVHCARLAMLLIEARVEPRAKSARGKRVADHVTDGVVP